MTPARWILTLFLLTAALSAVAIAFTRPSPMLAVVAVVGANGHGTGFAVGPNTVITNRHVMGGDRKIITLLGGQAVVERVWLSGKDDLAVLTVSPAMPHTLSVDCAWPARGTRVRALGHPLRGRWVSNEGRVASDLPWHSDDRLVVLDLTLAEGMSGGPVVDWRGRVVAVNVAYASIRGAAISLGIPGDAACRALKESRADG